MCKECESRKLWAYRTYKVHKFIQDLPNGPNTGAIFNFSVRNLVKYFANKFIIGHMASLWYTKALKEGKEVYDYNSQTRSKNRPSPSTKVSRV